MHFSLIFTRHECQNANLVEYNASDADFNSHSMPSLVSLSSSSYSSDSALSPSSSASQSSALRSLSPSSAFRFHQSDCDSNALGYHMLWVAGGNCVTASAVTATAGWYVTLLLPYKSPPGVANPDGKTHETLVFPLKKLFARRIH